MSRKRTRAIRKQSSGEFSVEELFPDDMGYDADVEVLKPMAYEEPESDADDEPKVEERQPTIDEELAARMYRLGQDQVLGPLSPNPDHGRKRKSQQLLDTDSAHQLPQSSDIEVQEVNAAMDHASPAKRRRKRLSRLSAAHHILKSQLDPWTDSPGRTDTEHEVRSDDSTSAALLSDHLVVKPGHDEVMDMS